MADAGRRLPADRVRAPGAAVDLLPADGLHPAALAAGGRAADDVRGDGAAGGRRRRRVVARDRRVRRQPRRGGAGDLAVALPAGHALRPRRAQALLRVLVAGVRRHGLRAADGPGPDLRVRPRGRARGDRVRRARRRADPLRRPRRRRRSPPRSTRRSARCATSRATLERLFTAAARASAIWSLGVRRAVRPVRARPRRTSCWATSGTAPCRCSRAWRRAARSTTSASPGSRSRAGSAGRGRRRSSRWRRWSCSRASRCRCCSRAGTTAYVLAMVGSSLVVLGVRAYFVRAAAAGRAARRGWRPARALAARGGAARAVAALRLALWGGERDARCRRRPSCRCSGGLRAGRRSPASAT